MLLAILNVVVLAQLSGGTAVPGRARGPAFSRDGRLAISVDGEVDESLRQRLLAIPDVLSAVVVHFRDDG